jgi:hypothetical protein
MQTAEQYIKLLDQCAENCKEKYCFFKTLALEKNTNPKLLCQVKCVEIFKWEKSVQEHEDIGWKKSWDLWVEEGYAIAFSQAYNSDDEDLSIRKVYQKTIEIRNNNNMIIITDTTTTSGVTIVESSSQTSQVTSGKPIAASV